MRVVVLVIAALLTGCSSATPPSAPPAAQATGGGGISTASRGLSCDSAIVIQAANENEGIKREMAWIRQNYPGATKESQDLLTCNDKPADAIHIVTANGTKVTLYFDISGWFGKM